MYHNVSAKSCGIIKRREQEKKEKNIFVGLQIQKEACLTETMKKKEREKIQKNG